MFCIKIAVIKDEKNMPFKTSLPGEKNPMKPSLFSWDDFSPELKLLIQCCNPQLPTELEECNEKKKINQFIQEGIDWKNFLKLVLYHQVLPVVYNYLQKCNETSVPPLIKEELKKRYNKQRLHSLSMMRETIRIVNTCQENHIHILCLKGPILALQYYPDISMRHMLDLDFLISEKDILQLHQILTQLGYETIHPELFNSSLHWNVFRKSKHHIPYIHKKELFPVEIHFRLFKNLHILPNSHLDIANRYKTDIFNQSHFYTLEEVDNLLFLFVHGSIHKWCLLKWLTDIAYCSYSHFNAWEKLYTRAFQLRLERPVYQGLLLLRDLYGIPLPHPWDSIPVHSSIISMTNHALHVIKESRETTKRGFVFAFRERFYLMKLKSNFLYRLRYFRDLFYLDSNRNILRLPPVLFPLYFILNPFLWVYKNYFIKKPSILNGKNPQNPQKSVEKSQQKRSGNAE